MVSRLALLRIIAASSTIIFLLLQGPAYSIAEPSDYSIVQPVDQPQPKRLPRQVAPKEAKIIPGEVIIKYKDQVLPSIHNLQERDHFLTKAGRTLSKQFNSETIATYPESGWVRIKVPPGVSTDTVIKTLSKDKNIEYARPNYAITLHAHITPPPTDYLWTNHFDPIYGMPYANYAYLWGLDKIGMQQGWTLSNSQGGGVVIAILDTGIDYAHPDLVDNYLSGKKFCGSSVMDSDGHGTYVAGIIGARGNNWVSGSNSLTDMKFFVGVNRIANVMALKIDCPEPNITDAIDAINYAVAHGAAVINGSWGLYGLLETDSTVVDLKNAITAATNTTLYVASAGNEDRNFDNCSSPTMWPQMFALDNLIVVAATDPSDSLWFDPPKSGSNPCPPTNKSAASNYGQNFVHLAAPGENIWSTQPRAQYVNTGHPLTDIPLVASGTSSSAPFVAGCAALLQARQLSLNPASPFSPNQLKSTLMTTGTPSSALNQKVAGGKRLNCYQALQSVQDPNNPPGPPMGLQVR